MEDTVEVPNFTWEILCHSRDDPSNCDMSFNDNNLPGLSAATREEREMMRVAFAQVMWLIGFLVSGHAKIGKPAFQAACNGARMILGRVHRDDGKHPFPDLTRKETFSSAQFLQCFVGVDPNKCLTHWGPRPGFIRDLLGPICMTLMVWLGDEFAQPLLDLSFAFATDYKSYTVAWLSCPVATESLDLLAVKTRAAKLRSSPLINSPGAAVLHLTSRLHSVLGDVIHAVFHAFDARGTCKDAYRRPMENVNITMATMSEAKQYFNCTVTVSNKVQSILPSKSSLPDIEPNFADDRSTTWFRSAQYAFESIKMPTAAALRGDPLSELKWHKYQSDVLHARSNVPQLSERQVIQHLSASFSRSDQHFTIAQETALLPDCTVRHWLDVIRDFYFTSGQFRMNIEIAWTRYNAMDALDFNELIHHIKTYYHLIFIDYVHMHGTQRKIDFACYLFNKLHAMIESTQSSRVSTTLRSWLSLADLLGKMKADLKPALQEAIVVSDRVAESFLEWVIKQIQDVRETANTAQFFREDSDPVNPRVDFAMMHAPRKQHDRIRNDKPALQAAAAVMHNPGPPVKRHGLMQNSSGNSNRDRPMVPNLKVMVRTSDPSAFIRWAHDFINNPEVPEDIRQVIRLELNGGATSLHGALSTAITPLPNGLQPTLLSTCQAVLKMFYLFPFKQCLFCPDARKQTHTQPLVPCKLINCACFTATVPEAARAAFFALDFNRTRQGAPTPAGHVNTLNPPVPGTRRQDPKRPRYDPDRKSQNQAKRPRASQHHQPQIR